MKRALLIALLCMLPGVGSAKEAQSMAEDPVLEKHVMAISEDMRCLVCQNESLAASHAELAVDLRNEIRDQIKRGASDKQVVDFMVQRYGDFVLYRPPVKPTTALLWFGPFVFLALGAAGLLMYLKRRRANVAEATVSEDERKRADAMLNDGMGENKA
jgi:cytochrome c-type biogenesis protein CcmH